MSMGYPEPRQRFMFTRSGDWKMRIPDVPGVLGKSLRYQGGRGSPKDPSGRLARAYYLERLRDIARELGGKLLSPAYVNDTTKLRFRCAEGHEFPAAPTHVKQGKWCRRCGLARAGEKRKAPAIARLHEIVKRRGGILLTPNYVNSTTRLRFQCSMGHQWETVPASVLQGSWCNACSHADPKRYDTQRRGAVLRLRRILETRRGTLLSEFAGVHVPIQVRCERGHSWATKIESLDKGAWCRACKEEDLKQEIQSLAARWKGECLSKRITGSRQPLHMRCVRGHRWISSTGMVRAGHWCPTCRSAPRGDIEIARRSARAHGGKCLSSEYVNFYIPLRWRCREGHEWEAKLSTVERGSWCRVCTRGWGRSRARLSIEVMREMAAERGGACLSENYRGIYDALRWRCARGHTWTTPANNVRRGGWCPTCARAVLGTFEGMRNLALGLGGRCVTASWINRSQPLQFECRRGHRFTQYANVVKTGVWCPHCSDRPARSPEGQRVRGRLQVR